MATITATEAYEAMLEHHKRLGEELAGHADAVSREVMARRPYGTAVAGLIAYLAEEVLPHAAAEEKTVYPAAARAGLAGTVVEMIAEHVTLSAFGAEIAALTDGATAARQAQQIATLFTAHAGKENDLLLPALLADESADLAGLLAQMHGLTAHGGVPAPSASSQPGDAQTTVDPVLDVRDLAPAGRHEAIFSAYHGLAPGAGFVLVNDHDPKPLGYQFDAEYAGQFTWLYLESGPEVWRVRIGRPAAAAGDETEPGTAGAPDDEEEPTLDVRQVSHAQRHGLIFTAYRALRPGGGFVLVNDHDPRPLRYQFDAQYADEYEWEYLEAGPAVWRVRIGRVGD